VKKERKIIVYIATSADGYIARRDGNVDWLSRRQRVGDYGMAAFYGSIDTILWGRKTYEVALGFQRKGIKNSGFDANVRNYVFSRKRRKALAPGVELVNEPIRKFARRLRTAPGKDIWMMGGAGLIASFLDAGEIDEFIVHVIPVLIGQGIPLSKPDRRNVPLALKSVRRFSDGVVRLHYTVTRRATRRPVPRKTG
jgi:dihydrofolate reductase